MPRKRPATMASRIKAGKVVPLVSNIVSDDLVLGGHANLVNKYKEHIKYPLEKKGTLPQLIQFKNVTDGEMAEAWDLEADYMNFVKNRLFDIAEADNVPEDILAEVEDEFDDITFSEFSERLNYPKLDDGQNNPLLLLANFSLPIYLTTSYHGYIEDALRKAGKTPRTEICRWHKGLESIPSVLTDDYEPSVHEPLVYHLHGFDEHPESLVLTEDNYLEYLVAISEFRSREGDRIAGRVRQALAESALILLGYSLRSWDFRTLFWGLIKQRPRQPKSVSVQLKRNSDEELYLKEYLGKAKFEVYWGDILSYLKELHQE